MSLISSKILEYGEWEAHRESWFTPKYDILYPTYCLHEQWCRNLGLYSFDFCAHVCISYGIFCKNGVFYVYSSCVLKNGICTSVRIKKCWRWLLLFSEWGSWGWNWMNALCCAGLGKGNVHQEWYEPWQLQEMVWQWMQLCGAWHRGFLYIEFSFWVICFFTKTTCVFECFHWRNATFWLAFIWLLQYHL